MEILQITSLNSVKKLTQIGICVWNAITKIYFVVIVFKIVLKRKGIQAVCDTLPNSQFVAVPADFITYSHPSLSIFACLPSAVRQNTDTFTKHPASLPVVQNVKLGSAAHLVRHLEVEPITVAPGIDVVVQQ